MPLFRNCYDYVRRVFFRKPRYPRSLGRFTTNDARWDPLKDTKEATLPKLFANKLKESGITAAQASDRLKLTQYYKATAIAELPGLPERQYRGGFKIPYCDLEGKDTGFYRFRYLEKYTDWGKAYKYAQPAGPRIEVYLTPEVPWPKLVASKDPIYITEGELKAICACLKQLPTLGLGGHTMFHRSREDRTLHPTIAKFVNKGRKFYIVFDSDAANNILIRGSEHQLSRLLTEAGAIPYIVRLPSIMGKDKEGKELKTGLDDYLMKEGKQAFLALVAEAKADARARALNELAAEVVYLSGPDIYYNPARDLRMNPWSFEKSRYSTWHYNETIETDDGPKKGPQKDTAKEFTKWASRPELENFTFAPGEGEIVGNKYNLWLGWPREPKKGSVVLWHRLLDQIFQGKTKAERQWFEKWAAYPIQHPGAKLKTAVLIWGGQGTGKSFLGEIIGRVYGPTFTGFDNAKLNGEYNDWAESKQFALGEEIVLGKGDRGEVSEKLKTLITGETITIHRKFLNRYDLPNCMNMIIVSNHAIPVKLEHDDRRFFVINVTGEKLKPELYQPLDVWSKSEEGLSALLHYFLEGISCEGFDRNANAPTTEDKTDMVASSAAPLDLWLTGVLKEREHYLVLGQVALTYQYWSAEQLLERFKAMPGNTERRETAQDMATALKSRKIFKLYHTSIRTSEGSKRLYFIPLKEGNKPEKEPARIGQAYDQEREDKILKFTEGGSQTREGEG
jgi:Family of unknown function (DUF5906)/Domain of unknown function (DUF3854)